MLPPLSPCRACLGCVLTGQRCPNPPPHPSFLLPRGEYGNLIKPKENIDFHLLITKVASVKFENTQGRGGNYMSHVLRLTDIKGDVCVSLFLMWPEGAERGKYAPGQVSLKPASNPPKQR